MTNHAGSLLAGLHIVDLSTYVAGPSAAMTLAQLGADVVRVDPLDGAADTRRLPRDHNGTSLYWVGLNKGKRSITINFSTPQGRQIVRAMLAVPGPTHGVVITNAVGQDWLTHRSLVECRSDLIHVHITGRADGSPAVDYTVNSEVGLPWITGPADYERPVNHVLPAWDLLTGLHAVIAVLTAVQHRRDTGRGQSIQVALADVAVATMANLGFIADVVVNGALRERDGNFLYGSYGSDFLTRDGRRVMVVALTARQWRNLVRVTDTADAVLAIESALRVDLSDELVRYENRAVIAAILGRWFADRTYADVAGRLDAADVLWGTYRTVEDLVHDQDSLMATSPIMFDVHQPGIGLLPTPGAVLRMGEGPAIVPTPAPVLGGDTVAVLREWLGLDHNTLLDLRRRRVLDFANDQLTG